MKPVLILQHLRSDGPGYLGSWLAHQGLPADVRNAQAGDPFPEDLRAHAALAILGGEMSANDDLPSLRQAEHLVRLAVQHGVPTVGHCLGGQLMARALGGCVGAAPMVEIGWHPLQVLRGGAQADDWFGPAPADAGDTEAAPVVFQWHYEAFVPPPGAVLLAQSGAGSTRTPQAFALDRHLALQFHVEADAAKIDFWIQESDPRSGLAPGEAPSVHTVARIRRDSLQRLSRQRVLADRIYARWWAAAPAG